VHKVTRKQAAINQSISKMLGYEGGQSLPNTDKSFGPNHRATMLCAQLLGNYRAEKRSPAWAMVGFDQAQSARLPVN
jgi:hypothetical protein